MVACSQALGEGGVNAASAAGGSTVGGEWVVLRDGVSVWVGPLATGDESSIACWFAGLGPETRYARFLSPLKRLDRRLQSALAQVDHVSHEAIAARAWNRTTARAWNRTTVGIARYIRLGQSRTAEVAVAVADDWRGRGIATILLDRVAERARAVGIEYLAAVCLVTNERMIRLFRQLGETTVGPSIAGTVDVSIDLTCPPLPSGAPRSATRLCEPSLRERATSRSRAAPPASPATAACMVPLGPRNAKF
jgi:GNAT superfamily N-acetyltransferase